MKAEHQWRNGDVGGDNKGLDHRNGIIYECQIYGKISELNQD
jgi:hypothetical protein